MAFNVHERAPLTDKSLWGPLLKMFSSIRTYDLLCLPSKVELCKHSWACKHFPLRHLPVSCSIHKSVVIHTQHIHLYQTKTLDREGDDAETQCEASQMILSPCLHMYETNNRGWMWMLELNIIYYAYTKWCNWLEYVLASILIMDIGDSRFLNFEVPIAAT